MPTTGQPIQIKVELNDDNTTSYNGNFISVDPPYNVDLNAQTTAGNGWATNPDIQPLAGMTVEENSGYGVINATAVSNIIGTSTFPNVQPIIYNAPSYGVYTINPAPSPRIHPDVIRAQKLYMATGVVFEPISMLVEAWTEDALRAKVVLEYSNGYFIRTELPLIYTVDGTPIWPGTTLMLQPSAVSVPVEVIPPTPPYPYSQEEQDEDAFYDQRC